MRQRGNILFLILLAVVLLAALTYAVTQSVQGGGKNASSESAQAQATDLVNYFAQLDTAVQRMMLVGGIKDYELNFYYQSSNKFTQGANDNTNCTESRCRVFDPAGGAVSGQTLERFSWASLGRIIRIFYISVPNVGTSKPDIVAGIYTVKPEICQAINKQVGLGDILYNVNTPTEATTLMYHFAVPVGPIPDTTATLSTLPGNVGSYGTFCVCASADYNSCTSHAWNPIVYHVLVAR